MDLLTSFLLGAALLHAAFTVLELFPWSWPKLLKIVAGKLPANQSFREDQKDLKHLVAIIVHNAGIYNGIIAGGLLWAAFGGASLDVARVMLVGAVVAGIFGAVTLGWATAIQAVVGIVGLILIRGRG